MKNYILFTLFWLGALPLMLPAQDEIMSYDDIIKELKLSKKGRLPYGFKLGTSREKIKDKMSGYEILSEEDEYITYTIYFNEDKLEFADITYDFKNDELVGGSFETYFNEMETSSEIFDELTEVLTKRYGEPEKQLVEDFDPPDVTYVWKYSKRGQNTTIELWDAANIDDAGFSLEYFSN